MNKMEVEMTYSEPLHNYLYECSRGYVLTFFGVGYEVVEFDVSRDRTIINFKCIEKPS